MVEVALPVLRHAGAVGGGRRGGAQVVASIRSPLLRQANMMCVYR